MPAACQSTAFACAISRRYTRAKFGRRLAKHAFEGAIELRERLKSHVVSDFADAQVWIQELGPRVFQAHAGDIISEF